MSQAKREAKRSLKWILVNIQSHLEFDCLCLNRDTWVDENVKEIIEANFIFFQRGHTSSDGKTFMNRYHVALEALPHCNILDPRTGLSMFIITVSEVYMSLSFYTSLLPFFFILLLNCS